MMIDRKMKKNAREIDSLRHRADSHAYNKKTADRKRRLLKKIRHLKSEQQ